MADVQKRPPADALPPPSAQRSRQAPTTTSSSSKPQPPSSDATPPLSQFFKQINAGSSSASALPFSAQHSLLSTQCSNVSDRLRQHVSSHAGEMRRLMEATKENEDRLTTIEGKTHDLSVQANEPDALVDYSLTRSLDDYHESLRQFNRKEALIGALHALREASYSVEAVEKVVNEGRVDHETYGQAISAASAACALVGISVPGASSSGETSSTPAFAWLGKGDSQLPRAVLDLERRIQVAESSASKLLQEAWKQSVSLDEAGDDSSWTFTIRSSVQPSPERETMLSAHQVFDALERRGKLSDNVQAVTTILSKNLQETLLQTQNFHKHRWQAVQSSTEGGNGRTLSISIAHEAGAQTQELHAVETVLAFLTEAWLAFLPQSKRHDFAKAFVPRLIQGCLDRLDMSLSGATRESQSTAILPNLLSMQGQARSLHATLMSCGLLPEHAGSPGSEESSGSPPRLLTWAESIGQHATSRFIADFRDEARIACLLDDEDAWETETIEVEPAVLLPEDIEEDEVDSLLAPTLVGQPASKVASPLTHETSADDWDWNDDVENQKILQGGGSAALTSQLSQSRRSSQLQRSDSTASQRSTTSSVGSSQAPTAPSAKRTGRSALGGVRRIRPQDQMGSGPFPGEEDADAWGFEDEEQAIPTKLEPDTKSLQQPALQHDIAPPVVNEADVDAWFEEEEEAEKPVPFQQPVATSQHRSDMPEAVATISAVPPPPDPSEEDDAWFADEPLEAKRLPETAAEASTVRHPRSADAQAASSGFAPRDDPEPEDVDEDAWGLSDAERAKRASRVPLGALDMQSLKTQFFAGSPSANPEAVTEKSSEFTVGSKGDTSHGDQSMASDHSLHPSTMEQEDLDEDAWGLSEAEKAKRASRLPVAASDLQTLKSHFDVESPAPPSALPEETAQELVKSIEPQPTRDQHASADDQSLSMAVQQDDFDEDAWGLTDDQQAAKRASRILPSSFEPAIVADQEVPPPAIEAVKADARTQEARSSAEEARSPQLTTENLQTAAQNEEAADHSAMASPGDDPDAASPQKLDPTMTSSPVARAPSMVSSAAATAPSSRSDSLDADAGVGENGRLAAPTADSMSVSSFGSDHSSTRPFPLESALPDDGKQSNSRRQSANMASQSSVGDGIFDFSSLGAEIGSGAGPGDSDALARSSVTHSSVPALVETASNASLPPTPKAEGDPSNPLETPTATSTDSVASQDAGDITAAFPQNDHSHLQVQANGYLTETSRPQTPTPGGAAEGDVPFPVHSAMPYDSKRRENADGPQADIEAAEVPSTPSGMPYLAASHRAGPPSVISDDGAISDVAMPPSPGERTSGAGTPLVFEDRTQPAHDESASDFDQPLVQETGAPMGRDRSKTEVPLPAATAERTQQASLRGAAAEFGDIESQEATPNVEEPPITAATPPADATEKIGIVPPDEAQSASLNGVDDDPWADEVEAQLMREPAVLQPSHMGEKLPVPASDLDVEAAEQDVEGAAIDTAADSKTADTRSGAAAADREEADLEAAGTEADVQAATEQAGVNLTASDGPVELQESQNAEEDGWNWDDEEPAAQRSTSSFEGSQTSPGASAVAPAGAAATVAGLVSGLTESTKEEITFSGARSADATQSAEGSTQVLSALPSAGASGSATPRAPRQKRKEECKISVRSRRLLQLARRIIGQSRALATSDDVEQADASVRPSALAVLSSILDVFELHRALLPSMHQRILSEVPSLTMQFANDCSFLAKEILLLKDDIADDSVLNAIQAGTQSRHATVEAITAGLAREAHLTTLLGRNVFESQLSQQAGLLMTTLQETDSLLNVFRDDRFQHCRRVLEQIISTVTSGLDRAWRGVLGDSARWAALGTLIESTLLRTVWGWVLEMEDIGEKEGQRLAVLLRLIGGAVVHEDGTVEDEGKRPDGLEAVFLPTHDAQNGPASPSSLISTFAPSWTKVTGYLPEILLGSLADVEFLLFDAGGLAPPSEQIRRGGGPDASPTLYISKDEAKRLIRSGFADTRRRTDLLARVDRGV
ncbi:unnamed protein product [Jaminaea pallidilutea]